MNKKILLLIAFVIGLGFASNAHADGNGSIHILYPNTDQVYWIKGHTYDVTFAIKNWDSVRATVYCENYGSQTQYNIPVVGDTTVETIQRWQFTVPTHWSDQSQCHVQIGMNLAYLIPLTPGVTYDENDAPFHIVSEQPILGPLKIKDVNGIKNSYRAPARLVASIKTKKPDGGPATPADGLLVVAHVDYAHPTGGASGPNVGGAAVYDPATKLWTWTASTALGEGEYNLVVSLYCPLLGSRCRWLYGDGSQVNYTVPFKVKRDRS